MSDMPSGPGARPKSSCRPSRESDGRDSAAAVFTGEPRFAMSDQGWFAFFRVATQMS